jgi:aspartyl-tRNA synthetase
MSLFRRIATARAFAHCGSSPLLPTAVHDLFFILAPFPQRTHNCGSLNASTVGARVVLAGWLLPGR